MHDFFGLASCLTNDTSCAVFSPRNRHPCSAAIYQPTTGTSLPVQVTRKRPSTRSCIETATKPNRTNQPNVFIRPRATLHSVGVHNSYTILTRETFVALVLVIVVIVTLGEEERVRARKRTSRTNRSKKKEKVKKKRIKIERGNSFERFLFVKHRRRVFKIFRI